MRRLILASVTATAAICLVIVPYAVAAFSAAFDGVPPSPTRYVSPEWDFSIHTDLLEPTAIEPMQAMHGPDCSPPPATHPISNADDGVFQCNDHIMTAISVGNTRQSGYGEIVMTPDQMVDFGSGATIQWDVSTFVTSAQYRDWWDVWISPMDEHVQLPTDGSDIPDLAGPAMDALHIRMQPFCCNGSTGFTARVVRAGTTTALPLAQAFTGYESFLTPSATIRSTFQLQLSPTHVKFGMPAYTFYWIDTSMPALTWTQGVVQFAHHSYNPSKACGTAPDGGLYCGPDTWHWDDVSISPSVPFTIVQASQLTADASHSTVTFAGPAPADAHLQFSGNGLNFQASYDAGRTWQPVNPQRTAGGACSNPCANGASTFWTAIPAGATTVTLKAQGWGTANFPWFARNFAIFAPRQSSAAGPGPAAATPTPTAVPPAPTPTPTAAPVASATSQPAVLLGDTTVETALDTNAAGQAEAFPYTANGTGPAQTVQLFVDASSSASAIVVGVYTNTAADHPGTLLGQATLSAPRAGAWNAVALPTVTLTAGTRYWIAVLTPTTATGTIQFRDRNGGGVSETSAAATLTALPTQWVTGSRWFSTPMSAYLTS